MTTLVVPGSGIQSELTQQAAASRQDQAGGPQSIFDARVKLSAPTHKSPYSQGMRDIFSVEQNTVETNPIKPLSLAQFLDSVERVMVGRDEWAAGKGFSKE